MSSEEVPKGDIIFNVGGEQPKQVLRLCANGDIYVHGKLADNDLSVVEGMRHDTT